MVEENKKLKILFKTIMGEPKDELGYYNLNLSSRCLSELSHKETNLWLSSVFDEAMSTFLSDLPYLVDNFSPWLKSNPIFLPDLKVLGKAMPTSHFSPFR